MTFSNSILMAASTVSPRWGSEGNVGWLWLKNSPPEYDISIITRSECVTEIKLGLEKEHQVRKISNIYCPKNIWPFRPSNSILAKINEWLKAIYYQELSYRLAKRLIKENNYSIIHQTTLATWRCGMPYTTEEVPTVWGPIGGGEIFPWPYASQTSVQSWLMEGGRELSNIASLLTPSIRRAIREVDVIIVTNQQTRSLLERLGRKKTILSQPMVISTERYNKLKYFSKDRKNDRLRIFSGGSLEGRKGYALTLRALAKVKKMGIPFCFTIGGIGMERPKLECLAKQLGIENQVSFAGNLTGDTYLQTLCSAHVFSFPSLRDNSPLTLIEAAAAGCVPIVLDNAGPGEFVKNGAGILLPLENPNSTVNRLADVIVNLWKNPEKIPGYQFAARQLIESKYIEENIGEVMRDAYQIAHDNFFSR